MPRVVDGKNEELWKTGLEAVLGKRDIGGEVYGGIITQTRGTWPFRSERQIVIPPNVKKSTFDELLDVITPGDLDRASLPRPVDGSGRALPVSLIRTGTLVTAGDGRYAVAMGDPSTPGEERWLMVDPNADEKFILNLNALEPVLKKRRPDLFFGGLDHPPLGRAGWLSASLATA